MKIKSIEFDEAKTMWQKFRGLMLKRNVRPLFFDFRRDSRNGCALHTFFMLEMIDIVFVNSEKIVVDTQTVRPWRSLIRPKKPARYVLELPAGLGKSFKVGTRLRVTQ